ncbi:MAG: hypothetical protein IPI33_08810 [Dehalococcoidia bacterium]|jgi:hypothetical protein|uniref:hypothetical protein n=2 Tax=Candidatus Amarobacter glycogenicus TaxID=3140699 RepID=UPI001D8D7F10|nr:hypothetical protein [Dehalococcoidia bacterium]MBK6563033.1 hypothetical protein [Dehalococcoidia bacterium]MBK7329615.1 hypothetical protein [Dehalococcoidia bacterium]MBK7725320.1 hypothetical protein [Dehalococcoidia bacterium]
MRNENGIDIDIEALNKLLNTADLITIGFTLFPERLLVDTRSNDQERQFADMVEPVANIQERYVWLGKHRGSFGAPEGFAFFVWPQTVRGLIERDALAPLKARLTSEARRDLDVALATAAELERGAIIEAIKGSDRWPAVWERAA